MSAHLPILAIVWPLFFGVLTSLLPPRTKPLAAWGSLHLLVTNLLSLSLVSQVYRGGEISYRLSGWAPPMGIELRVTLFSALLTWLVSMVALLGLLGSVVTWEEQIGQRVNHFLALLLLLVASFQGLALSNDAFNLYVMLEISSLATYGLIAFGGGRAYLATFHYIVMGTIGASFYLLGVGYLYIKTGTLNVSDLSNILAGHQLDNAIILAIAFLITGLLLKMAVFPLHFWLPNAYTYAPAASSVVIAPLSTKLAVFLMFRVLHDIFGGHISLAKPYWSILIVLLACFGILAGSSLALAQRDLKKTFACLIVAEAGYMLGGLWLIDPRGTVGALFHLVNDALATLALFLVVIAVRSAQGGKNLSEIKGLFQQSPLAAAALVLTAFNLIGVPPSAGFFSKMALISGAIGSGRFEFALALILASLANIVIFFRIIEMAYFHPPAEDSPPLSVGARFSAILAFGVSFSLLLLGTSSHLIMENFIRPVVGL